MWSSAGISHFTILRFIQSLHEENVSSEGAGSTGGLFPTLNPRTVWGDTNIRYMNNAVPTGFNGIANSSKFDQPWSLSVYGINAWAGETTETLPGGMQRIVYTNYAGEIIAREVIDAKGQRFMTYNRYDSQGRLILKAMPSAVTSLDSSLLILVGYKQGAGGSSDTATGISPTQGLIYLTDYGSSLTASGPNSPGDVPGLVKDRKVEHGLAGSEIDLISSTTYDAVTVAFPSSSQSASIYPVASQTVYAGQTSTLGDGSDDPRTTRYGYAGWNGFQSRVDDPITLPPTPQDESNGNGDTIETWYDSNGRPRWALDATGHGSFTGYDDATGSIIVQVEDINVSSLPAAPAGFNYTIPSAHPSDLRSQMAAPSSGLNLA